MRQLLIPILFTQEFKTMVRTGTEEILSVFRVSTVSLRNSTNGCHYKKNLLITYHFISIQNSFFKVIFQNPSLIISSHVPLGLQSSQTKMYEDYDLLRYDTV